MEQVIKLRVDRGGTRLDKYIAQHIPELSRSRVQKLLDEDLITIGDRVLKASYEVEAGDLITVRVPPPQPVLAEPETIPLQITYEDADLIVVDKPAGMVVHPAHGHRSGTLVNALLAYCPDLAGIGGQLRPGIVHRLDKDTSGLIVVAKNDAAHSHLQRQFKQRQVEKTYLALTEGRLPVAHGVIDTPIGRDPRRRKRMAAVPSGGRQAQTQYTVREFLADHTYVEARPITGRTHQVRVHFAAIGHPLVGDRVYGHRKQQLLVNRHFLHAARLAFSLPSTEERIELVSELPGELTAVLESLRKR